MTTSTKELKRKYTKRKPLKERKTHVRSYSEDQIAFVLNVFKMRNEKKSIGYIADKLGTTRQNISLILNGKSNKAIIDKYNLTLSPEVKGQHISMEKTPDDIILTIFELYKQDVKIEEISELMNIKLFTLQSILTGKAKTKQLQRLHIKPYETLANKQFSKDDIVEIFALKKQGMSQVKIAEKYSTWQTTISSILTGRMYNKEREELGLEPIALKNMFNEDDIKKIFKLQNKMMTHEEIAKKFDCKAGTISAVLNKKIYKEISDTFNLKAIKHWRGQYIKKNKKAKTKEVKQRFSKLLRTLSEEQVLEVFRLRRKEKVSRANVAKMFNLGPTAIEKLENGRTYKDIIKKHNLL
ncbi:MAG: hypothetical protein K0R18_42 [Bacillales bacterium]|jgi:transcriptional regulator/DNA-binding XRE family transcriptional regulator|nr:hypothetical protein [Bacillales bacterium]